MQRDPTIYLQGKYLTDMVEISPNVILVASFSDCSYYLVDLNTKETHFLSKGYSAYAMGIAKFPGYSYDTFPWVLAKEDDCISLLHVRSGFVLKLTEMLTHN